MCFLLCIALSQRAFVLVFFSAKMNRRVENSFDFLCLTTGSRNRKVEMLLKFHQIFEAAQCFLDYKKSNTNFTQIIVYFILKVRGSLPSGLVFCAVSNV